MHRLCTLHVLYMHFTCFLHASYIHLASMPHAAHMLLTRTVRGHYMHPHALHMHLAWTLHAPYKPRTSILHAHCMRTTCSLHACYMQLTGQKTSPCGQRGPWSSWVYLKLLHASRLFEAGKYNPCVYLNPIYIHRVCLFKANIHPVCLIKACIYTPRASIES